MRDCPNPFHSAPEAKPHADAATETAWACVEYLAEHRDELLVPTFAALIRAYGERVAEQERTEHLRWKQEAAGRQDQIVALRTKLTKARGLLEYVRHQEGCSRGVWGAPDPCSCGLEALLLKWKEGEK